MWLLGGLIAYGGIDFRSQSLNMLCKAFMLKEQRCPITVPRDAKLHAAAECQVTFTASIDPLCIANVFSLFCKKHQCVIILHYK